MGKEIWNLISMGEKKWQRAVCKLHLEENRMEKVFAGSHAMILADCRQLLELKKGSLLALTQFPKGEALWLHYKNMTDSLFKITKQAKQ